MIVCNYNRCSFAFIFNIFIGNKYMSSIFILNKQEFNGIIAFCVSRDYLNKLNNWGKKCLMLMEK